MEEINSIGEMRRKVAAERGRGRKIALVPTMGYFHEGHLSLMRKARREADILVVSVFVNPTQFGPGEDLRSYPRDLERDLRLAAAERVDYLFVPGDEEMYQAGHSTVVEVEGFAERLCAVGRPGHFSGVATVVAMLFNIVEPDIAVFGQKDFQQLQVIKRMVQDLRFPVEVIAGPTVREADGVAMSSRNDYLSEPERLAARVLPRALELAKNMVAGGDTEVSKIRKAMLALINDEELVSLEYLVFCDPSTLDGVAEINVKGTLIALAAYIGSARLIDNYLACAKDEAVPESQSDQAAG